jgi:hypothetical protein
MLRPTTHPLKECEYFIWNFEQRCFPVVSSGRTDDELTALLDGPFRYVPVLPRAIQKVGISFGLMVNNKSGYRDDWKLNSLALKISGEPVVGPFVIARELNGKQICGFKKPAVTAFSKIGLEVDLISFPDCQPYQLAKFFTV